MGGFMSSALDKNMKKQQEFMLENQKVVMQRQLAMQRAMMERQMAMQIGRQREMFMWWGTFASIVFPMMLFGAYKRKNPAIAAPIIPLSFIIGYQADMAYNNKLCRIRDMAEDVLVNETYLTCMPKGFPTFDEIERRRLESSKKTN